MSVVFKIRREDPPEFRRLSFPQDQCTLAELRIRVADLFNLSPDGPWEFRWVDEDGDAITVTRDYELQDVVASNPKPVVRLDIVDPTTSANKTKSSTFPDGQVPNPGMVAEQLLQSISSFAAAAMTPRAARSAGRCPARGANPPAAATTTAANITALCDVTDQKLVCGSGNWYHLPQSTYDLHRDAWEVLPEADRNRYVLVDTPEKLGAQLKTYAQVCPRRSSRRGPKKPSNKASHVGWCDATGQMLVPGKGWYHKTGENFDLGEAPFQALESEAKAAFVQVNCPDDLGADAPRYSANKYAPQGLESLFDVFVEIPHGVDPAIATAFAATPCTRSPRCSPPPQCARPCQSRTPPPPPCPFAFPEAVMEETAGGVESPRSEASDAVVVPRMEEMAIVAGPSIAGGTRVDPGSRLMPVWEVMNTSSEPTLWTDIRVRPRDPNPLAVAEEGVEVPMLAGGESGLVCVEFTVPSELAGKAVEAHFDLYDKEGNVFGDPLTVELHVKCPEREKRAALIQALRDMGFTDLPRCHEVLDECKDDLSTAVQRLLN